MDASDLHIKEGVTPMFRIHGSLVRAGKHILSPEDCRILIFGICNKKSAGLPIAGYTIDFAYEHAGNRYRVVAYLQKSTYSASIRFIKDKIPSLSELNVPPEITRLAEFHNGLILVTGPAGSGKSTTLAAIINHINERNYLHIITLEDPIEYIHKHKRSIVTQRELGSDIFSFSEALRNCLRQDPNVILIGELRDPSTIASALQAAETGHLVLSTLHTQNSIQTIKRIVDVFSGDSQQQIRLLLANNLKGVVSQRLIRPKSGKEKIPAVEIMVVTPTIAGLILEGNLEYIYKYLEYGKSDGMMSMNQSLGNLYSRKIISLEEAMENSEKPDELRLLIGSKMPGDDLSGYDERSLMSWM